MKQHIGTFIWVCAAGLIVGFLGGWYGRPILEKDTVALIALNPQKGFVNNPSPGTDWILYEGTDHRFHWGYGRLPNTDGLPSDEQPIERPWSKKP
jgi:hypothetical protein